MLWMMGLAIGANSVLLAILSIGVCITMAKEQDLETSVAALEVLVVEIAAEIAELKSNGAQNVTQEQLDSLDGRLSAVVAAFKAAE